LHIRPQLEIKLLYKQLDMCILYLYNVQVVSNAKEGPVIAVSPIYDRKADYLSDIKIPTVQAEKSSHVAAALATSCITCSTRLPSSTRIADQSDFGHVSQRLLAENFLSMNISIRL
jgi:hypothetical protein